VKAAGPWHTDAITYMCIQIYDTRGWHTFLPLTIHSPSDLTVVKVRCDNLGRLDGVHLQQTACQVGADISVQAGEQQLSWKYTYVAHTCRSALAKLQLHANCS
jgi:hypothetical protein